MFVDREAELAFLERAWTAGRAELIVVYGRRRVGEVWTVVLDTSVDASPPACTLQ